MKKIFLVILAALCIGRGMAQVYNNEWIDYTKTYYRFKVGANGLYRISQSMLTSMGLGTVQAQHFQLWSQGTEVPLFTSVPSGTLGASDYLEFYGQINDGSLDKKLFKLDTLQMNDKWSLYADTAIYFLTVNTTSANKRLLNPGNNVAGNILPAEAYFMHTLSRYYKDALNPGFGVNLGEMIYSSTYETAEGWGSNLLAAGRTAISSHNNLQVYASGPAASLVATVAGATAANRTVTLRLNGNVATSGAVNNYTIAHLRNHTISLSVLAGDTASFAFSHSGVGTDNIVIASYQLSYPRKFNFGNATQFYFELPAGASKYLEISNFNAGAASPVLYDIANNNRQVAVVEGGVIKFVLPASAITRKLVLLSTHAPHTYAVNSFTQRNFINYALPANQGDYLVISHHNLFNDGNGNDYVEQYRQYRASVPGGGFNAKTINAEQLVDQFAFGVKHHPASIRNFAAYSLANFTVQPKYIFLVGKGVHYADLRRYEKHIHVDRYAMVPTFGWPASDNLLTATRLTHTATIPVGRLSAITGAEVGVYLEKVKEYEQVQSAASQDINGKRWMKNIAHITGGLTDPGLAALINYYMGTYRSSVTDTLFGADVYSFSKNAGLTAAGGKSLEKLFEEGLSMVTYFGHSSPNSIEFNLDNPNSYNNAGKYPVIMINGCNSGNLFAYDTLRQYTGGALSEKFVLANKKGSIAYIATTHFGLPTQLDYITTAFYRNFSRAMYGQPLGNLMQTTMQQVMTNYPADYIARTHVEEINLHGDPAVRMNNHTKPDYVITEPMLSFAPAQISQADTRVKITARFTNIGRAVKDSLSIRLLRMLPDSQILTLGNFRIKAPALTDSIVYTLNLNPSVDSGTNHIIAIIDPANLVDELSESNNTVTKSFTIVQNEIRPVWPYNFSITDINTQPLYASTAYALSEAKEYVMQLDTTEKFNSPLLVTKSVLASGGVLKFEPGIVYKDSTVYYWRVATGPVDPFTLWRNSSFMYINGGQDGFAQAHYDQYKKNSFTGMKIDSNTHKFAFDDITRQLLIRTGLYPYYNWDQINLSIDQEQFEQYGCVYNSIQFTVYNPVTLQPWKNFPVAGKGSYGSYPVCNGAADGSRYIFEFPYDDTAYRRRAMEFFDIIPDGYYVSITNLGFTGNTTFINRWKADTASLGSGKSLWHKFQQYGLTKIDSFYKNLPFLFVFKKGDAASFATRQYMGESHTSQVIGIDNVPGSSVKGSMESGWMGPVNFWNRFKWKEVLQAGSTTTRNFDIIGRNTAGNEVQLARIHHSKDTTIDFIDATIYPYLKVRMNNADAVNVKPTQLKHLMLTADHIPEGAISPYQVFAVADTLAPSDTLKLQARFVNVSNILFDSIRVKLTLTSAEGARKTFWNRPDGSRYDMLIGGDSVLIQFNVPLTGFFGMQKMVLEVNPDNDQPEMHHFNNYIFKTIYVTSPPVCPGSTQLYTAGAHKTGNTYQWQVNTGTGYTPITESSLYTGTTTANLQVNVNQAPTSMYGYRYTCKITNGTLVTYSPEYLLKFSARWTGGTSTQWSNIANWDCGVLPDANTDVIVPTGLPRYPIVAEGVMARCRSIKLLPGATAQVDTGGQVEITGPPGN
ncbi:MAG TPA: C25 family cysteine peptidase [Ferruginibacter sp.]|nr:C25 family cysteine peptidase [Ferruginibacter sp.]HMP20117.1 C25 family cysteine peptidase [Ferruginibacter sp.]